MNQTQTVLQRAIRNLKSDLMAAGVGEMAAITIIARNPNNDDQIVMETNEDHLFDPMAALFKSLKK